VSDRGGEFREKPLSHGTDREPGNGGRRFLAYKSVEKAPHYRDPSLLQFVC
jgi:hypothetical protein